VSDKFLNLKGGMKMRRFMNILLAFTIAVCFSVAALAAEHPGEHPGTPAKTEHKEHPGTIHEAEHPGEGAEHPGEKAMLSAEDIIRGIKEHINSVTKANAGYFLISDPSEGKDLRLKLIKVHEDKVSFIKKEDAYFACTDFVTADGKTKYDLDFWMKEKAGKLNVYQTKIHKKDGNPRFTYKDDEMVPVESESNEHKEHPGQMAPEEHT